MAVLASSFIKDTLLWIRDSLLNNVVDPIGRENPNEFIFTSYPKQKIMYPVITINDIGIGPSTRLGMGSEEQMIPIRVEIRVWARNTKERDSLAIEVYHWLRENQIGDGDAFSQGFKLHNFRLINMRNIEELGEEGVKSKVMELEYTYITE